jgi:copper chaperone CopZ
MKQGIKMLCGVLLGIVPMFATGQATQNDKEDKYQSVTLQVPGVCKMCKKRIETASYDVSGVKTVEWDLETEVLTAVINNKKVTRQQIADALAKVGYRSELAKADPEAYAKLPACCQYDSGVEKHGD